MDRSPEEDFPSDTETARGQGVTKKPKVTAAIFYKRTSARPAAKSSSGQTSRQPIRDICHVETETLAENETAITDAEVALNVHQEGSDTEIDNIMHVSPALADVNIGIVEEEVPWSSIAPDKPFLPLLFVHDIDDDYQESQSPPSSSGSIVVDTPSHAKTATVTSTRTLATASKSTPLPEKPSPSAQPSVSGNRKSKVWEHFITVGDGRLAKCKLCGKEVSCGKVLGHLTNAGMDNHLRTHHKAVLMREESGLAAPPSKRKGSSSASSSATMSSASDNLEKGQGAEAVVHPSKGNQSTIEQFTGFHPRGISRQQSRKITRLIGELIAIGGAPFNMVEGEPFKRLLKALAPQYIVPSRTTFSRSIVPALYKSCVEKRSWEKLLDSLYI
ncbi:uncharacterized protein LOC130292039 isoform X2 [Hyla sarda]|uniref:uncharacterized protein LOC130292039 isoform X2 n=1 Tax=Hyla sarda TaxID=327740 RepID=UPI0024C45BBE|nr:uncharacterized protein LOC130292039 isoform X2 [Hyla sarda]